MKNETESWRALLALALIPVVVVFGGWSLKMLWGWFVVPLGAPPLGVLHAFGLSLTFYCLRGTGKKDNPADDDGALSMVLRSVYQEAFLVGSGWVVHWFMVRP